MSLEKIVHHYNDFGKLIKNVVVDTNSYWFEDFLSHVMVVDKNKIFKHCSDYQSTLLHMCDIYNNSYYNNLYFSWIKECVERKKVTITCPFTKKVITTDNYFILNIDRHQTTCNYYFEAEEIVLGIGLGTYNGPMSCKILYLYSLKANYLFYKWPYNDDIDDIDDFKNRFLPKILETVTLLQKINFENIPSKITTIYGFMSNMGHMLFNDCTGLYFLDAFDITSKIDEVVMGNLDIYRIKRYFQKYENIHFTEDDFDLSHLKNRIGKGFFFKYNHCFISDKCVDFLKNNLKDTLSLGETPEFERIQKMSAGIKSSFYPIINIVLRKGDYEMINQDTTISNLINMIVEKYPNAFFFFDGLCKNDTDDVNQAIGINFNNNYFSIKNKYSELVENIISRTNTPNYLSLIDKNILEITTFITNCNYAVYILGSAACNGGWLCSIPGVQFGRSCVKIYENMDKITRENMCSINYYNEDTIVYDKDNNFTIDAKTIFDLIPEF